MPKTYLEELTDRVQKRTGDRLQSMIALLKKYRDLFANFERPFQIDGVWQLGIFDNSQNFQVLPDGSKKPIYGARDRLITLDEWIPIMRTIVGDYVDRRGNPITYRDLPGIVDAELVDVARDLNEVCPIGLEFSEKENSWFSTYVPPEEPEIETVTDGAAPEPATPPVVVTEFYRGYAEGVSDEADAFYAAALALSLDIRGDDSLLFALMDLREAARNAPAETSS